MTNAATSGSGSYPAWGLGMTYDRYGNRTAQSITSGCVSPMTCPTNSVTVTASTNRLASPYGYDANGNMTNDGVNTIAYDAENHAVSSSGSLGSGTYTYDGNGLRIKKVSASTTTVYIFSGSKVVAEYVNGAAPSSPTREYLYSGSMLLAKVESGATNYYHRDHLSNRLVTNSSGAAINQIGHFPYGESWYSTSSDKLVFTSYERDSESGNDYAMARMYVSRLGRFSAPDPLSGTILDPQSLNRYAYAQDNPIMMVDPSGMSCEEVETRRRRKYESFEIAAKGPSSLAFDSDPYAAQIPDDGGCIIIDTGGGGVAGGGISDLPLPTDPGGGLPSGSGSNVCATMMGQSQGCTTTYDGPGSDSAGPSLTNPYYDDPGDDLASGPPIHTIDFGGGGSGGTTKDFKERYYKDKDLQQKLSDCVKKVFREDASSVPDQTIANSPTIDTSKTSDDLNRESGGTAGVGWNKPDVGGPYGTVYIPKSLWQAGNFTNIARTYTHELGNLIDERMYPLNPINPDKEYGRHHKDLQTQTGDLDTGQALEDCVFGRSKI